MAFPGDIDRRRRQLDDAECPGDGGVKASEMGLIGSNLEYSICIQI